VGEELEVWVSNISDWEDEDSVEWLSSIKGDESLARKTVSFCLERIDCEYIDNLGYFSLSVFCFFLLSGERLFVVLMNSCIDNDVK